MKYTKYSVLLFCFLLLTSCSTKFSPEFSQFSEIADSSQKIPDFPYEIWTLKNGLKVYYVHDPELPLFSASIFLRGGSYWEKSDEVGLYSALGDNMRYGGAGRFEPLELDAETEKYAASLSSGFKQEFGSVAVAGLSSDRDHLFSLMSDVLLRPKFSQSRLDLWKSKSLEGIKRRVDDPNTIASISTRSLLLGKNSYGIYPLSEDIKAISREKIINLHKKVVIPNGAILAISGDISREQVAELSEKYFSDWAAADKPLPEAPPFPTQYKRGIFFIEKDLKQATVIAAHLGPDRHTPDIYKIDVFNQYFGSGGFGSALMKRVRTELGLAYGIYGMILPGFPKGRALIQLQTKPESVGLALKESLSTLEKMKTSNLNDEELTEAKNVISNAFIFNFTSPGQVLGRKVEYQLTGFPEDYESRYLPAISKINPEDIRKLANDSWRLEDLVITIVGPKSALHSLQSALPSMPAPISSLKVKSGKFLEAASFE